MIPILCLLGLGYILIFRSAPTKPQSSGASEGEVKSTEEIQPEDPRMRIYLLIGKSAAADTAQASQQGAVIERCFQLNAENTWEPTVDRQLPEHDFARAYLAKNPTQILGLVLNTRPETGIDDWVDRKVPQNKEVRQRVKFATMSGKMSGVIWFQGTEPSSEGYGDKLKSLVSDFRNHLSDPNLPFIMVPLEPSDGLQEQLESFSKDVHLTGIVTPQDGPQPGSRCAELATEMEVLHLKMTPKPPKDIKFIDPHVHAISVTPLGLRSVAQWMEERNVERCIVSPLDHKGSRPKSEEEYQTMLANFAPYKGKIDRMCIIKKGEVQTVDEALAILKREIADGAIAFGEHYGEGLMFDDPQNLMLYEACEKVGLPVMFHIDQNKNMVEQGMERVDKVLKMYPNCKLVAHAYWWRQLGNGSCDRQLQEHPNLYADMSGSVVIDVLNRDCVYAREFLIRNQDKILWATDEGWWSFGSSDKQANRHYTFLEELDLPDEVRRKIYRENSEKVYGLKPLKTP